MVLFSSVYIAIRHYFANKGPSSQGYSFSSGHVWMWELDCEEGWVPKNWCFWIVVLEKTLERPLDCKEIQPVHSADQPWDFFGRNDAKAEAPVLWPPHAKSWLIRMDYDSGWDWGQEEKGTTEDEMAGWHHWLDERESEWTLGAGDGQGGLACCDSWGRRVSDLTESQLSDWTELKAVIRILQARPHQYMNWELPDIQAGFRKGRGTRNCQHSLEYGESKGIPDNRLFLLHSGLP